MNAPATNVARLSEFDFVVLVDTSGSMGETDCPSGRSRYAYAEESLTTFARDLGQIDSDGIDVVLFGGAAGIQSFVGVTVDKVKEAFATRSPRGGTPLAEALTEAFKVAGKSDKKDFILVLTDGVPDDKAAAAKVIIDQANSQETDDACTVLFIQVGRDTAATAYLRELDDNLKGAKFDIVDVKTIEEAEQFSSTADLVLAAIEG